MVVPLKKYQSYDVEFNAIGFAAYYQDWLTVTSRRNEDFLGGRYREHVDAVAEDPDSDGIANRCRFSLQYPDCIFGR